VLCATDTVAALAIVREKDYPTLNSILFGEGVVNDAVSILIFNSINQLIPSGIQDDTGFSLTWGTIGETFYKFLTTTILSVVIGVVIALMASFVLKRFPSFQEHPVREILFLFMMMYLSYVTSEILQFSGNGIYDQYFRYYDTILLWFYNESLCLL
jgi:NhaP-type Na+/H+ or K+/H+ antiporter